MELGWALLQFRAVVWSLSIVGNMIVGNIIVRNIIIRNIIVGNIIVGSILSSKITMWMISHRFGNKHEDNSISIVCYASKKEKHVFSNRQRELYNA